MTPKLTAYIEEGMALDLDERLEAARQLLLSVDDIRDDEAEASDAWAEVVDLRLQEVLSGTANLVDGREAHASIRAKLADLRR